MCKKKLALKNKYIRYERTSGYSAKDMEFIGMT